MYIDMDGVKRLKMNPHAHTTDSDGRVSPEEAARIYREAGRDVAGDYRSLALAQKRRVKRSAQSWLARNITWVARTARRVYIIFWVWVARMSLKVDREEQDPQRILDAIHAANGLAVLAHPAWSLNSVSKAAALHGVEATEIRDTRVGRA